jgi:hypothetical protein
MNQGKNKPSEVGTDKTVILIEEPETMLTRSFRELVIAELLKIAEGGNNIPPHASKSCLLATLDVMTQHTPEVISLLRSEPAHGRLFIDLATAIMEAYPDVAQSYLAGMVGRRTSEKKANAVRANAKLSTTPDALKKRSEAQQARRARERKERME